MVAAHSNQHHVRRYNHPAGKIGHVPIAVKAPLYYGLDLTQSIHIYYYMICISISYTIVYLDNISIYRYIIWYIVYTSYIVYDMYISVLFGQQNRKWRERWGGGALEHDDYEDSSYDIALANLWEKLLGSCKLPMTWLPRGLLGHAT